VSEVGSIIQTVEQDISNVVHHTRVAVQNAISAATATFETEKAVIAADIKKAAGDALSTLEADEPAVLAALKDGAKAVEEAVIAALAAHGL
jgi:hypothetical protein